MELSIVIPCYNEAENAAKIETELFPVVRGLATSQSLSLPTWIGLACFVVSVGAPNWPKAL